MIIPNDDLRMLCIKNQWFTNGDIKQYDRLFQANRWGMSLAEIATIIWICSDDNWTRSAISAELEKARKEYDDLYEKTVDEMERYQAAGERAADEIYCGYYD
jgi:hypothetical protein